MMIPFNSETYTQESRKSWSDAAEPYEKLSFALFGPIADELILFSGIRKGWNVLDVACGPGIATISAARRAGEKGQVLGVDLAPGMIAQAQSRQMDRRHAPIRWQAMDAQALDLPEGRFDAVICQLGLMLFAQPHAALKEMRRVAKPGAPVACLVQGRKSAMMFTSLIMNALIARAPHLRAPQGAPTLYSFGSDGVLEESFAHAGLSEIVTKRLNGIFRFKSADEYWEMMTQGSGRTGAMLRTLSPELQAKVKADVLRRANKLRVRSFIEIPYEFVMAKGFVPIRQ